MVNTKKAETCKVLVLFFSTILVSLGLSATEYRVTKL